MFTNITCMSLFDNHSSLMKSGNSITRVTLERAIGNFQRDLSIFTLLSILGFYIRNYHTTFLSKAKLSEQKNSDKLKNL